MNKVVSVIKSGVTFSTYKFYTDFLTEVAEGYKLQQGIIEFKLFENDDNIYDSNYKIDPIAIPLLLSLFEQLRKFHKQPLTLHLFNNAATIRVLEFLDRADFFKISGSENYYSTPKGRNILDFDAKYLGDFSNKRQRSEHRVRAYSLQEDNLESEMPQNGTEEDKRDFLSSVFTYKVKDHFSELLFGNEYTYRLHNTFIDILSELITNGVLHSRSDTYALMYVDKFKSKFSISDNGIGLKASMESKFATIFYTPKSLTAKISHKNSTRLFNEQIINNLCVIFETLYYSSLKDRDGLFDLMINVVLKSKGYFRLHTDNCQIIVSNRMMVHLTELDVTRSQIMKAHRGYSFGQTPRQEYEESISRFSDMMKEQFVALYDSTIEKYNSDVKYSSLRLFKVRFKGVHIEVEIPNA